MTTLEGKVKDKVKALLDPLVAAELLYYHMAVVTGYGKRTLDFTGCHRGRYFSIETKAGSDVMTKKQEDIAEAMRKGGATVFLINAVSGLPELEAWLEEER